MAIQGYSGEERKIVHQIQRIRVLKANTKNRIYNQIKNDEKKFIFSSIKTLFKHIDKEIELNKKLNSLREFNNIEKIKRYKNKKI